MIEWKFLFIILDKMGFLKKFTQIINLLFVNAKANV